MKKWLIKILVFLFPLFVYGVAFEWYCYQRTFFAIKRNYALHHLSDFKVAFTGTSHIEKGIYISDPENECLNWAAPGQSFPLEFQLWKKYIGQMPHLKVAFIELSPTRLYLAPDADDWSANLYWLHYRIPFQVNVFNPRHHTHLFQDYSFFKNAVHSAWNPWKEKLGINEKGYAPEDFKDRFWECQFDTSVIRKSFVMKYDFKTSKKDLEWNRQYVDSIVEILNSHNVKPVFLIPPFYDTFEDAIPPAVEMAFEKWMLDLKKKECTIWDYRKSSIWTVKDYYNDNHLNPDGAKKWYQALRDSVNRITH